MSETGARPRLWSDFDGTAVELVGKMNPRNWSKYPLRCVVGYPEFLRGAQCGGVEIAGIISRRPNIAPRRWATARSIVKLGLSDSLGGSKQLVLAGSEKDKGIFLASESRKGIVGMVEDKSHKLGSVLLGTLVGVTQDLNSQNHPIVIGVVSHSRSQEYVERLVTEAQTLGGDVVITEPEEGTFSLEGQSFTLNITSLQPYTEGAGRDFARKILIAAT